MSNSKRKIITFEEGWNIIHEGINNILEDLPNRHFTSEEYMNIYTTIYNMCSQKPPYDYSDVLYEKYKTIFEEYIVSTVLPSLREKKDELLIIDLVERWSNHKTMTKWLSNLFRYLDGGIIKRRKLPSLENVAFLSFYDLVYKEMNGQVKDAITTMGDKKRTGEPIDEALFNNIVTFHSEIEEIMKEN